MSARKALSEEDTDRQMDSRRQGFSRLGMLFRSASKLTVLKVSNSTTFVSLVVYAIFCGCDERWRGHAGKGNNITVDAEGVSTAGTGKDGRPSSPCTPYPQTIA